jgi:DNA-binding response OmpR family regulator
MNNTHVFIVEDDRTMIGLLKTLLEMEGCKVTSYAQPSAEPITETIKQISPDIILMDVNLRDADGMEILQNIRADESMSGIRIIMSSGSDYKDLCLRLGADDFLMKPYMPDDLIKMIKKVLALE